ncbi:MAG: queuosine precursor transporter [Acidobacteriota bacterium]
MPSPHRPPPDPGTLERRRELVFLVLAGVFLGAMAMLNILGLTRFVQLGPLTLAVGVLPYPLTFLCTDLIGELFGRRRARDLVWIGFGINVMLLAVLWLGQALPPVDPAARPPWQDLALAEPVALPDGTILERHAELFRLIYGCTSGAVLASMVAYLAAQFCDVYLFHFWKDLTRGRHLWLRNNGSTVVSQLVDSVAVVSITFGAAWGRGEIGLETLGVLLASNYAYKLLAALADTLPFYVAVAVLSRWLRIDPRGEYRE